MVEKHVDEVRAAYGKDRGKLRVTQGAPCRLSAPACIVAAVARIAAPVAPMSVALVTAPVVPALIVPLAVPIAVTAMTAAAVAVLVARTVPIFVTF